MDATRPSSDLGHIDQELIDRLTYLGSLVSAREAVEPMLDSLRIVTSRWEPPKPLAEQDRSTLQSLESQLKDYLVHGDPLRTFTPESLERRLHEQKHAVPQTDSTSKRNLAIIMVLTLGTAFAMYIVPIPNITGSLRTLIAIPLSLLVMHLGAAWFYLSALRNFKPELHRAFRYLATGIVTFSLLLVHYSIIEIFDLSESLWFRYGGLPGLVTFSFICLYLGMRQYALLLKIKTRATSLPVVFGGALASGLMVLLVPHAQAADQIFFNLALGAFGAIIVLSPAAALLAYKIKHTVTAAYAKSIGWVYVYLVLTSLGLWGPILMLWIFGELRGSILSTIMLTSGAIPQFILLYSGYSFKNETSQ